MNTDRVVRLEVIDHTTTRAEDRETGYTDRGRVYRKWDEHVQVELSFQDDGRTLKVFITDRA